MHKYLLFLAAMLFYSCSADNEAKAETPTMNKIYITIDGQTQSATLVDNDATRELVAALQDAPITVTLNDNDFEIWGSLGKSLTTKNEQMTALPGDCQKMSFAHSSKQAKTTSVLPCRLHSPQA